MRKILLLVLVLGLVATGGAAVAADDAATSTPGTIVDRPTVLVRVANGATVTKQIKCVGGSELDGVRWIVTGPNRHYEGLKVTASQWVRYISPGVERNGARFRIHNDTGTALGLKLTALCSDVLLGSPQPRKIIDTPQAMVAVADGATVRKRLTCAAGSELDGAKWIVPGWHRAHPGLVVTVKQWVGGESNPFDAGPLFVIRNNSGENLRLKLTGLCSDVVLY